MGLVTKARGWMHVKATLVLRDVLISGPNDGLDVRVLDRDLHTMTTRHQFLESIKDLAL